MAVTADPTLVEPTGLRIVSPPPARRNPIRTRTDWDRMRAECIADPGRFHGEIAKRELHWFHPSIGANGAWITWDDSAQLWSGFDAVTGASLRAGLDAEYTPWSRAFNGDAAPFWKWFEGALTNAGFNEVDRHVLAGHGAESALIFEGDRWDMSIDNGRGGPVDCYAVSRRRLLLESAKCSIALGALGVKRGDRIALNMPNIPAQLYWTEGAKRIGVVYTPVFGGFSDKTLSDRIQDAGARVVITADGGYRNAQIVPFKTAYTDPALDDYTPLAAARTVVHDTLRALELTPERITTLLGAIDDTLAGEITVQRSDVMRGVGRALQKLTDAHDFGASDASKVRS